MDKLDRQVVRHKDRLQDHHHSAKRLDASAQSPRATRAGGLGPLFRQPGRKSGCRRMQGLDTVAAPQQPATISRDLRARRRRTMTRVPIIRFSWTLFDAGSGRRAESRCRDPMNRLAAILPASNVLVDVDATSKKRAFEHAGLLFENQHAIARATVTDNLFARERLGSTGLGHGVAIPHGRIKGLKNPLAAVLRVQQPIPLRRARRRTGGPADLPAGARGGHPAPPGDSFRDRRDAVRPRTARTPEVQGYAAEVHELIHNWVPLKSAA